MPAAPVALVVLASLVGGLLMFAGIFAGTLWLIARVGWARLARTHAAAGPTPPGQAIGPRLLYVGPARYRGGAVRLVCAPAALVLVPHPLFRFAHRPIALPYADLTSEPTESGLLRLRVRGSDVALRLPRGAWSAVALARGQATPSLPAPG